jgi:hypothetical protein
MGKAMQRIATVLPGRRRRGVPTRSNGRVDTELVIEAARLVVTTRLATRAVLERQLDVSGETADLLLARLEHCEVIGPDEAGVSRRVLATSGQLPELVAEFQRRR